MKFSTVNTLEEIINSDKSIENLLNLFENYKLMI